MSDRTPPELRSRPYFAPRDDHSDTEATAFVGAVAEDMPQLPDAGDVPPLPGEPPPMPMDPMDRPHTRESFAIQTIDEDDEVEPTRMRKTESRHRPAPRRKRPTLLPKNMPRPGTNNARRNQSVMQPVRSRQDVSRPDIGSTDRESSDVVHTFNPADRSSPKPMNTDEGLRKPRGDLRRKPGVKSRRKTNSPKRRAPAARAVAPPPAARPAPSHLPLSAEQLGMLIADQRRRLHLLDAFARGLEICAGVLGTLSLAVLIAALVSILVGSDVSVLNASSALIGAVGAMALTLMMVVAALAMRQLAHLSAQVAALLEALSHRR